jgi:hypothetical protein
VLSKFSSLGILYPGQTMFPASAQTHPKSFYQVINVIGSHWKVEKSEFNSVFKFSFGPTFGPDFGLSDLQLVGEIFLNKTVFQMCWSFTPCFNHSSPNNIPREPHPCTWSYGSSRVCQRCIIQKQIRRVRPAKWLRWLMPYRNNRHPYAETQ